MLRHAVWGILLVLSLGSIACDVINPDEPQAAYIQLEPPLLIDGADTLPGMIPDVWLFQVPDLYGIFTPPVRLPFLQTETKGTFIARAGVWESFNAEAHEVYPFLKFDTLKTQVFTGQTTVFQPVFRYFPDTVITPVFEENFEGMEMQLRRYGLREDTAFLVRSSADPLQGNGCGYVQFTDARRSFDVVSINTFALPRNGTEIWAEVKFKGNIKFALGLIQINFGTGEQALTPQILVHGYNDDGWKAAYFRLTVPAALAPEGTTWRLRLYAVSDGSPRELFLDNVRILRFK
ncbi:MAG: hypothetical protein KF690_02185 [Bacteroidetes bacterium]|nr:hypothetical protein [Bacteroidota bacterium]